MTDRPDQMWRNRLLRPAVIGGTLLTLAGIVLLVNLVGLFSTLNERSLAQMDAVREDAVWSAYQLDRETSRLAERLQSYPLEASLADVTQRFDILYSRTSALSQGQLSDRFNASPALSTLSADIRSGILALTPRFDAIVRDGVLETAERDAIRQQVKAIEAKTSELVIAINAQYYDVKVAERAEVITQYSRMAQDAVGLAAVFVALIILLALQVHHIRRLSEQSKREADAAAAASRAKSTFLAAMSHEIRTPLNGILGTADLMMDDTVNGRQLEQLKVIRQSGDMLLDVINDILDFSKLESGSIDLAPVPFQLSEVARNVREVMAPRAMTKGLSLDMSCPTISIVSDPARLTQVLVNFVGNAIKFTETGHVSVSGELINFSGGRAGLRFAIKDSGIGMTAETRQQLFQEFVQGDPSISRRFGGTGLGLAICKRVITAMGGHIRVESTPGLGSTFTFEIPCEVVANDSIEDVSQLARTVESSGHVLVVEDNRVNQQVAAGLLAKMGLEVTVVNNGLEAVDIVARQQFSVVLMDMQMPEMDGLTATREIRAAGYDLPIIGVTANAFQSDKDACMEAGMNWFLPKPLTRTRLEEALARFLTADAAEPQEDAPVPLAPPSVAPIKTEGRGSAAGTAGDVAPAALQLAQPGVDLEQQQALLEELGAEQLAELMTHFFVEARDLLSASTEGALQDRVRAMHSLKGMARTLGMTSIGMVAAEAESKLRAGRNPNLDQLRLLVSEMEAGARNKAAA